MEVDIYRDRTTIKRKGEEEKKMSSRHGSGHLKPSLCDRPWDELVSEGTCLLSMFLRWPFEITKTLKLNLIYIYLAFLVHIWRRVLHSKFKLQCSFQYLWMIWMKWKLVNVVFDHVDFRKDLTPLDCVPYSSTTNPLWMMFILGKAFGQHHQFGQ